MDLNFIFSLFDTFLRVEIIFIFLHIFDMKLLEKHLLTMLLDKRHNIVTLRIKEVTDSIRSVTLDWVKWLKKI